MVRVFKVGSGVFGRLHLVKMIGHTIVRNVTWQLLRMTGHTFFRNDRS